VLDRSGHAPQSGTPLGPCPNHASRVGHFKLTHYQGLAGLVVERYDAVLPALAVPDGHAAPAGGHGDVVAVEGGKFGQVQSGGEQQDQDAWSRMLPLRSTACSSRRARVLLRARGAVFVRVVAFSC